MTTSSQVLYGLDYLKNEGRQQRQLLRDAIIGVTRTFPDSLIVVEEYDRMDCDTRSMLRQLFHHPELAHVNLGRTIFLMVSNRGMFELQDLLREAGGRDKVGACCDLQQPSEHGHCHQQSHGVMQTLQLICLSKLLL